MRSIRERAIEFKEIPARLSSAFSLLAFQPHPRYDVTGVGLGGWRAGMEIWRNRG